MKHGLYLKLRLQRPPLRRFQASRVPLDERQARCILDVACVQPEPEPSDNGTSGALVAGWARARTTARARAGRPSLGRGGGGGILQLHKKCRRLYVRGKPLGAPVSMGVGCA